MLSRDLGRLTALVVSAPITVIVSIVLAPGAIEVLGPQALLVAYAGAAVAVGATAYLLMRRAGTALTGHRDTVSESPTDDQSLKLSVDDELVECEFQQLREN